MVTMTDNGGGNVVDAYMVTSWLIWSLLGINFYSGSSLIRFME